MDASKVFKVSYLLLVVGVLALFVMVVLLAGALLKANSDPQPAATVQQVVAPAAPTTGATLDRKIGRAHV